MDIFYAIEHSDKELLSKLVKSKLDVNTSDEFGQTPLHLAIDTAFEEAIYMYDTERKVVQPRLDLIEILLKNGANHLMKDENGKTPIDWARERKNEVFNRNLNELIKINNTGYKKK